MIHSPSENAFPHEIERMIFITAADDSLQTELVAYMRVARRVHAWLIPFLYEMLVFPRIRSYAPIPSSIKHSIMRCGHHVRHLVLAGNAPSEDITHLLYHCPNIERVFFWCKGMGPEHQEYLNKMPLRQLSCHTAELFPYGELGTGVILEQSMFNALTMLEITNKYDDWGPLRGLALLPKLTHLALMAPENNAQQEVYKHASRDCRQIKILLAFQRDASGLPTPAPEAEADNEGWGNERDSISLQEAGLEQPDEYDYSLDFGELLRCREDIDPRVYEFHIRNFFLIPGEGLWEKVEFTLEWIKKHEKEEDRVNGHAEDELCVAFFD